MMLPYLPHSASAPSALNSLGSTKKITIESNGLKPYVVDRMRWMKNWFKHLTFQQVMILSIICVLLLMFTGFLSTNIQFFPSYTNSGSSFYLRTNIPITELHTSIDYTKLPSSYEIAVVADLDKKSKEDKGNGKLSFTSIFRRGVLRIDQQTKLFSVEWKDEEKLSSALNEGGRGMELSELHWFQGNLYSFDDRTGIVYRIDNLDNPTKNYLRVVPEQILMEGDGSSSKGQKNEWATVKDGELYIGSIGKEYVNNEGQVINENGLWVAVLDPNGHVKHINWSGNYYKMRNALDCESPGYLIHEAIEWSALHQKWFVFPRRVSHEAYNDILDEQKGSNVFLIADEQFNHIEIRHVGQVDPTHGFSSFKFLPKTHDQIIIALKSVENEEKQIQETFVMVFDIDGKILMEETKLPGDVKYEGISLLQDWAPKTVRGFK